MQRWKVVAFTAIVVLSCPVGHAERRTATGSVQASFSGVEVGQCPGFDVLADWVALISWVDRFDKDGEWVETVLHHRVLGESLYYNSTDDAKAVSGGPGEIENVRYDAPSGRISASGLPWKIRIPGHGLIWAETGALEVQCEPYTFEGCEVVSNVGHNQFQDGDLEALCDYLK